MNVVVVGDGNVALEELAEVDEAVPVDRIADDEDCGRGGTLPAQEVDGIVFDTASVVGGEPGGGEGLWRSAEQAVVLRKDRVSVAGEIAVGAVCELPEGREIWW